MRGTEEKGIGGGELRGEEQEERNRGWEENEVKRNGRPAPG